MKKKINTLGFFWTVFALFTITSCADYYTSSTQPTISFQTFYDELAPYGRWVEHNNYGYVWIPDTEAGFEPYRTNGYWVSTNMGWTWYSRYEWGWGPFHYGRWWFDPFYGWLWIPGSEWAPAWVGWCEADDYYGWAPLPPGLQIDINLNYHHIIPRERWHFIHRRDLGAINLERKYVGLGHYLNAMSHSFNIRNFKADASNRFNYNAGPEYKQVSQYAGKKIKVISVQNSGTLRPQQLKKDRMRIFKPEVTTPDLEKQKPVPQKVQPHNNQQWNQLNPEKNKQELLPRQPKPIYSEPKIQTKPRVPSGKNPIRGELDKIKKP